MHYQDWFARSNDKYIVRSKMIAILDSVHLFSLSLLSQCDHQDSLREARFLWAHGLRGVQPITAGQACSPWWEDHVMGAIHIGTEQKWGVGRSSHGERRFQKSAPNEPARPPQLQIVPQLSNNAFIWEQASKT